MVLINAAFYRIKDAGAVAVDISKYPNLKVFNKPRCKCDSALIVLIRPGASAYLSGLA